MSTTASSCRCRQPLRSARADLFVLRRVTGNQFVHFGGSGRGAGWAGLSRSRPTTRLSLAEALTTRSPSGVDARRQGARLRAVLRARRGVRPGRRTTWSSSSARRGRRVDDGERRRARRRGARWRRMRSSRSGPRSSSPTSSSCSRRSRSAMAVHGRRRVEPRCARSGCRGRVALMRARRRLPRRGRAARASSSAAGRCARRQRRSAPRWQRCSTDGRFPSASRTRAVVAAAGRARRRARDPLVLPARADTASRAACCSSRTPTPAPRGFTLLCRRLGRGSRRSLGAARRRAHAGVDVGRGVALHAAFAELDASTSGSASGATSSAITSNHT